MDRPATRWSPLRWLLGAGVLGLVLSTFVVSNAGASFSAAVQAAPRGPEVLSTEFPTIQDALDYLRDQGGGTLHIPAGTYLLSEKARVHSNTTVYGDGMGMTILMFPEGIEDNMMANNSGKNGNENIVIRDLTLQSRRTTKGDCCHGIRLLNAKNVLIQNVEATGFSKDGFYLGYYTPSPETTGVYDSRISGCRATLNGRNGISLVHGQRNIIDNCLVDRNNRREQVGGIDLEPDEGLDVSDNKVIGNTSTNQNGGIGIWVADPDKMTASNNAVCYNTARNNRSAGIHDKDGTANIFVGNVTTNNGTNFLVDKSAKVGPQYAAACEIPPLGGGGSGTPTPTATGTVATTPTATPTATVNAKTLSTSAHTLAVELPKKGKTVTLRAGVEVRDGAGAPIDKVKAEVALTGPGADGPRKVGKGTTRNGGRAEVTFKVKQPGTYRADVSRLSLKGYTFVDGPGGTSDEVRVP